ncbi:MAG: hypothetical protein FWC21_03295 [Treponema sp.]|nr:hypothetical protein [Treponema sp.]
MNAAAWKKFLKIKNYFKNYVEELSVSLPFLKDIQQELINGKSDKKIPSYVVETPVVYNTALDDIKAEDEIKMILVADNPGRREQAAENRRYLVGPSGKIAAKFFKDNPSLGIDFNKNVIILNKTPIHSPRTVDLGKLILKENVLIKNNGINNITIKKAVEESQKVMASILYDFHEALDCPVWITGYSEMKKNKIFEIYTEELKKQYKNNKEKLFIYRHFSMNQFTIDLKKQALPGETIKKTLKRIGIAYRHRILGNN